MAKGIVKGGLNDLNIYQEKTVTPTASNQEVTPDSGYEALSSVTINGDANLIAENIKSGITIFGIIGTYTGA